MTNWTASRDGNVALTRGLVVSCNAYFAQLGVQLGPQVLLNTAALFQIAPATPATASEVAEGALPFASYGQGEVRATPLRMATVAGAIAAGGLLHQPYWMLDAAAETDARNAPGAANARGNADARGAAGARGADARDGAVRGAGDLTAARRCGVPPPVRVIDPAHASEVAAAMRQVVTAGTGRSLAGAVVPIAGKTGTAQINGAASHSWFIGFAPYGARQGHKRERWRPHRHGRRGRVESRCRRTWHARERRRELVGHDRLRGHSRTRRLRARATPVVAEVVRAARDLGLVREPRE